MLPQNTFNSLRRTVPRKGKRTHATRHTHAGTRRDTYTDTRTQTRTPLTHTHPPTHPPTHTHTHTHTRAHTHTPTAVPDVGKQMAQLLGYLDLLRLSMAGNLRDYELETATGKLAKCVRLCVRGCVRAYRFSLARRRLDCLGSVLGDWAFRQGCDAHTIHSSCTCTLHARAHNTGRHACTRHAHLHTPACTRTHNAHAQTH